MKSRIVVPLIVGIALILTACKAECPPERISFIDDLSLFPEKGAAEISTPTILEIKGKQIQVDRVITGPVCNETWSGTVYVSCDIQIPTWEQDPFFWQDCDFEIEEGTVVYVEAHNDKKYDKGCSCHE
jgi:hypothetical protein